MQNSIGIIGGTGPEGRGLALRLGLAGLNVQIGSRESRRAEEAATNILSLARGIAVSGALNEIVAVSNSVVFLAVPYLAQRTTLERLKHCLSGKTVVVVAAPIEFSGGVAKVLHVTEGSAALQVREILPDSAVASAFQTISHRVLLDPSRPIDADVVVCADRSDTRSLVMDIVEEISNIRAVNGGGLENSVYLENFAAFLININKLHKANTAIKIVGI